MKPHDKRRLNALIDEEEHGAAMYAKMSDEMRSVGHLKHARLLMQMADDEEIHAKILRKIKAEG